MVNINTSAGMSAFGPRRRRGLRTGLGALWNALRDRHRHNHECRKLEALPDYLLDDVGLTRADLRRRPDLPFQ